MAFKQPSPPIQAKIDAADAVVDAANAPDAPPADGGDAPVDSGDGSAPVDGSGDAPVDGGDAPAE